MQHHLDIADWGWNTRFGRHILRQGIVAGSPYQMAVAAGAVEFDAELVDLRKRHREIAADIAETAVALEKARGDLARLNALAKRAAALCGGAGRAER